MAASKIGPDLRAKIAAAWPEVLAGIAAGELVKDVLERAGLTYKTVRTFIQEDPDRRLEWDDAREESAEAFMAEALTVARSPGQILRDEKGEVMLGKDGKPLIVAWDSAHARTRIDTLKWAARIRNPRAYSDKAQLDVNVKTVDLTRIIESAQARLAAAQAVGGRVLEHGAALALPELAAAQQIDDLL